AIVLPQTLPPERPQGGVVLVGSAPQVDVFGPEAPQEKPAIEIYSPRYTQIVAAPTPTPTPIYVYCNTGGKYYHAADCRYVKDTSDRVSLSRALDAGYKQCPECAAPSEYEVR
ncbi:MAG: hypothetical protein GX558_06330, partial [Clostridiales bacterium]|nr:hypothetical protein [Clostridiales bacterium]